MIKKLYNIIIEKEKVESAYFIHCSQLGVATQGDNIDDALLMFADALKSKQEYKIDNRIEAMKNHAKKLNKREFLDNYYRKNYR